MSVSTDGYEIVQYFKHFSYKTIGNFRIVFNFI